MMTSGGLRAGLVRALVAGTVAYGGVAAAQTPSEPAPPTGDIVVTGENADDRIQAPQRQTTILDTPATVSVISEDLMAQQGRTTLRDTLRNITGISFQAGEGNPPGGGDAFSVRGFSSRDDILVDGMRDIGNYFRDPFIAHRIDVTKGPASAFAGRGNVGGTVNILTFVPKMGDFLRVEATGGTANLARVEADANLAIDYDRGIALRLSALAHRADEAGRDVTQNRRWAIAPTLVFGIDNATMVQVNVLHTEQNNIPDFGIPNVRDLSFAGSRFFGQPAPVPRNSYYGYSTDYQRIVADTATIRIEHEFDNGMSLLHQTRLGRVSNDSIASAPRWFGAPTEPDATAQVFGRGKPRDQVDRALFNQTALTMEFGSDAFHHTLVIGGEASFESAENLRRLDPDGPPRPLFNPPLIAGPIPAYNGTRARMDTDTLAFYLFDTVELGDRFRIVGGLRFDNVRTRVQGFDDGGTVPAYVTDIRVEDNEWSGNLGFVYKPNDDSSIYIAYGTAFEPSGRSEVVQLAGVNNNPPVTFDSLNADPERSASWELGARTEFPLLGGEATLSGALFQITKNNARHLPRRSRHRARRTATGARF
jgi:catecholate siderophore receptor